MGNSIDDTLSATRESVLKAFKNTKYPGNENLVPETSFHDSEENEIKAFLFGKHWSEVDWEIMNREYKGDSSAILALLTNEASIFYLPAFLQIALDSYDDADLTALSPFNFVLYLDNDTTAVRKYIDSRVNRMTNEMLSSIRLCAEYLINKYGTDETLEDAIQQVTLIIAARSALITSIDDDDENAR